MATAAEKSVLFIHTNKSNASGVILFDKTFKAELGGTQSEPVIIYNEYTLVNSLVTKSGWIHSHLTHALAREVKLTSASG